MAHPSNKNSRLRRKILNDPEAKRVLLKVMTHGGKETVELDGVTYTVERMNIWDRPMDRILEDEDDGSVQEDDSQGPLSALWRAGKKLFMAFWWAG